MLVTFLFLPDGEATGIEKLNGDLAKTEGIDEIIEALRANPPTKDQVLSYERSFQRACVLADKQRIPALIDVFETVQDSYGKTVMFEALARAWIRTHMPDKLAKPVESVLPAEPVYKKREDSMSFLNHQDQYWQVLGKVLRGKNIPESVQLVDRYTWGSWCGTGADRFTVPQAYARVIGDMQEKRWRDMAGEIFSRAEDLDPVLSARLLAAVLADPFDTIGKWIEFAQAHEKDGYFWKEQRDGLLAIAINLPTERRLDFLESLLPQMQEKASVFKALGKFVPVGQKKAPGWRKFYGSFQRGLDQITSVPASESEQKRALELLNRQAFADLGVNDAQELARVLGQKYQADSIPALQQLLQHPSEAVAKEAAEGLAAMGEKAEIPEKLGDVRCKITVNGKPLSVWSVERTMVTQRSRTSSNAATSEDGVLLLPRDWFLNPGEPVTRIVLANTESPSLVTPRFVVEIPPPAPDTREVIPVDIATEKLTLKMVMPRPIEEYRDREMQITLASSTAAELSLLSARNVLKLPVADHVEFPALAPGGYQVEIRIPGTALWRGNIVVGEGAVPEVQLVKATDVRFDIKPPEPWRRGIVLPELWQGGKRSDAEFDHEQRIFRGVPSGAYTLKIPSSAQLRKKLMAVFPDGPEFDGTERDFEIKPDSPMEIDLGEISLSAPSAKKEK